MARTREHAEELAWRPWARIGPGVVDKGLALRDDRGTWWEMATRTLVGSIVEDTRVAVVG